MEKKKYVSPIVDVIKVKTETALLNYSGETSNPNEGGDLPAVEVAPQTPTHSAPQNKPAYGRAIKLGNKEYELTTAVIERYYLAKKIRKKT